MEMSESFAAKRRHSCYWCNWGIEVGDAIRSVAAQEPGGFVNVHEDCIDDQVRKLRMDAYFASHPGSHVIKWEPCPIVDEVASG
jgi:hypothetical protein